MERNEWKSKWIPVQEGNPKIDGVYMTTQSWGRSRGVTLCFWSSAEQKWHVQTGTVLAWQQMFDPMMCDPYEESGHENGHADDEKA